MSRRKSSLSSVVGIVVLSAAILVQPFQTILQAGCFVQGIHTEAAVACQCSGSYYPGECPAWSWNQYQYNICQDALSGQSGNTQCDTEIRAVGDLYECSLSINWYNYVACLAGAGACSLACGAITAASGGAAFASCGLCIVAFGGTCAQPCVMLKCSAGTQVYHAARNVLTGFSGSACVGTGSGG